MQPVFDHRMFRHINEVAIRENGRASQAFVWLEKLLRCPWCTRRWRYSSGWRR
jgi:hypothetical protein